MREAFFVSAVNGHGKRVEVYQPNVDAARQTKQRLVDEGLSDVMIESWPYNGERTVVE